MTRLLWAPLWTEAGRIERRIRREVALGQIREALIGDPQKFKSPTSCLYVVDRPAIPQLPENEYGPAGGYEPAPQIDVDPPNESVENIYDQLKFETSSQISVKTV
jgi:hypothetical protein